MSNTHNAIIYNGEEYGGGSGGHGIVDAEGNEMPYEKDLQFRTGFNVTDDSENGKTIVELDANAADVSFDNTGTDLESTNAEDAIKEVDGKVEELSSNKQNKTDNSLATIAKTVVGAINEMNGKLYDNVRAVQFIEGANFYTILSSFPLYCNIVIGQASSGSQGYPSDGIAGWMTYICFRISANLGWVILAVPNVNSSDKSKIHIGYPQSNGTTTWYSIS